MIRVAGSEGIAAVAAACRRVGRDRTIVNTMVKEIRQGIPPIRTSIRDNIVEELPHKGGLGVWVAKARITAKIRRAAASAGVAVRVSRTSASGKRTDLKRIDAGTVRHPTFGHKPWRAQTVNPNSITDGVTEEGRDQLEQAALAAVARAAEVIGRG